MKNHLLAMSMLGLIAVSSFGQNVRTFVSTEGLDNGQCSKATPCRTFNAALAAVNAGGEVVALDTGGFGPITVNKAAILVAPAGVHAAIAPTSGNAITVNPGAANVVIRGLFLNSQGSLIGIQMDSGFLDISDTVIQGFIHHGIRMSGGTRLSVRNTDIRTGFDGMGVNPGAITIAASGGNADIQGSRFLNGYSGVWVQDGTVIVRDSVSSGNQYGYVAFPNGGGTARLSILHCDAMGNSQYGLFALGDAKIYVANSRIKGNAAAVYGPDLIKSNNTTAFEENTNNDLTGLGFFINH